MSKRNIQQQEYNNINFKDVIYNLEEYKNKPKEIMNFEIRLFIISVSILISTNIYIHKTVKYSYLFLGHK
jgi:hypothetical protein